MAIAQGGTPPALTAGLPDGRAFLRASFRRWFEFFHTHRLAATVMLKEAAAMSARSTAASPSFDNPPTPILPHASGVFRNWEWCARPCPPISSRTCR